MTENAESVGSEGADVDSQEIKHVRRATGPHEPNKRDNDARLYIALALVAAYILLLAATVVVPFLALRLAPTPAPDALAATKEITTMVSASVGSLTGVLGFVLGYYFKAKETEGR